MKKIEFLKELVLLKVSNDELSEGNLAFITGHLIV